MTKSSSRISLKTVGLLLLLSGVFVALSSGAAQATGVGPTDIEVKKTATVTGTVVSGVITIKNKAGIWRRSRRSWTPWRCVSRGAWLLHRCPRGRMINGFRWRSCPACRPCPTPSPSARR